MRLLLTHEGYEVRTAQRAEDALAMLADYRPELIMADIQLPGMSGLDMTRKLKDDPRTCDIRVVALTACAMKEDRERALSAGCEDFISKPIDTATLPSRVRELLARPAGSPVVPAEAMPVDPAPDSDLPPAFSGPEIESLRRRFLKDGTNRSLQLAESVNADFDAVKAAKQLHQWVGSAALIGHPEISNLAREAEALLSEQPLNLPALSNILTDLHLTFDAVCEKKPQASEWAAPENVTQAIRGKRVALIGFAPDHAEAMCAALAAVKAKARLYDATENPESEAIQCCDIVIFHVRPETRSSSWLEPRTPPLDVKNLVFTGEQADLIRVAPEVRSRAVDFLVGRGQADEVLMRLAFVATRSAAAAGPPREPAKPVAAPGGAAAGRSRLNVTRPSIVIADDDSIVRAMVGPTLQNYGMSCRVADNGIDALRLIRSEPPHVAVLDVNMPGMEGYEVLAAVRAENLPTRVILLTARQQEQDVLKAFDLGADDYLVKPFNPFELVARVKRLLR